jgi:hypothetical protein
MRGWDERCGQQHPLVPRHNLNRRRKSGNVTHRETLMTECTPNRDAKASPDTMRYLPRRRAFVVALGALPAVAAADRFRRQHADAAWVIGAWRSDIERAMRWFAFQGKRPGSETLSAVAQRLRPMTHAFTSDQLIAADALTGQETFKARYRVVGATSNTVSIEFPETRDVPGMTLYREENGYFVRSGDRFEFFQRALA